MHPVLLTFWLNKELITRRNAPEAPSMVPSAAQDISGYQAPCSRRSCVSAHESAGANTPALSAPAVPTTTCLVCAVLTVSIQAWSEGIQGNQRAPDFPPCGVPGAPAGPLCMFPAFGGASKAQALPLQARAPLITTPGCREPTFILLVGSQVRGPGWLCIVPGFLGGARREEEACSQGLSCLRNSRCYQELSEPRAPKEETGPLLHLPAHCHPLEPSHVTRPQDVGVGDLIQPLTGR